MFNCGFGWGGFGFGAGGIGMWITQILFWGLLIGVVVFLIKGMKGHGNSGAVNNDSSRTLAILERRYAKGEIDKSEFEEKKRDLGY